MFTFPTDRGAIRFNWGVCDSPLCKPGPSYVNIVLLSHSLHWATSSVQPAARQAGVVSVWPFWRLAVYRLGEPPTVASASWYVFPCFYLMRVSRVRGVRIFQCITIILPVVVVKLPICDSRLSFDPHSTNRHLNDSQVTFLFSGV